MVGRGADPPRLSTQPCPSASARPHCTAWPWPTSATPWGTASCPAQGRIPPADGACQGIQPPSLPPAAGQFSPPPPTIVAFPPWNPPEPRIPWNPAESLEPRICHVGKFINLELSPLSCRMTISRRGRGGQVSGWVDCGLLAASPQRRQQ